MSIRKTRKAQLERNERPTALPSRTHWASQPRFIQAGSRIFDEVFRIGLAFPFGATSAYLLFDMREVGRQNEGFAAFKVLMIVFGIALIGSVLFCVGWAYLRQQAYHQARRLKQKPPDPKSYLGRSSLALGFLAYVSWRFALNS